MVTIETCDGYFMLIDDAHGKVGIAQTKSRTQACRIRDALNADNTILGRRLSKDLVAHGEGIIEGTVVGLFDGIALVRRDNGELFRLNPHCAKIVSPPCEAGSPIEASRGTHLDSVEARHILNSLDHGVSLRSTIRDRLEAIASEPSP